MRVELKFILKPAADAAVRLWNEGLQLDHACPIWRCAMQYNLRCDHPPAYVKDYQSCKAISERVGQLAAAHPLLFHALVTGYGPLDARCVAIATTESGAKLRDICSEVSIPYALRSLPSSVLLKPLQLAAIPEECARLAALRIGRLPHQGDQALAVQALFYGTSICDDVFGLWLAHPRNLPCLPADLMMVRSLAFYAWQSRQENSFPYALNQYTFSPYCGWNATVRTAVRWFEYFKFQTYFGDTPIADMWAEPYRCGDYEIVPLRTAGELLDEALSMDNCLRTYADDLDYQACRLFSVRRAGRRLGTVEIRPGRDRRLRVVQFRGWRNAVMDVQPWDAVHDWIARQKPLSALPGAGTGGTRTGDPFKKILQAHQTSHALPDQFWIGIDSLKRLEMELALLKCGPANWRRAPR